jgi:peptidoglycan/LPS O-acetylase OafA/YrhL
LNLGRYGDFSSGTYLYAFPVQQFIVETHGGSLAPTTLFMLATPISIALGAISWFVVERRFLGRHASPNEGPLANEVAFRVIELEEA